MVVVIDVQHICEFCIQRIGTVMRNGQYVKKLLEPTYQNPPTQKEEIQVALVGGCHHREYIHLVRQISMYN
jgi:hypothetical protein